ncbi:MAG: hypothetical protein ACYDB1_00180 [Acidiferrobacteraceae bacterium]
MSTGDLIAILNLAFTVVTTICALFLSYTALKHTTRPNIGVRMLTDANLKRGEETKFIFEFTNRGHWYGSPTAVDVTVFCNFDPAFDLREIRYGSIQEIVGTKVRIGVGNMKFLKAEGLKLSHREEGEQIHIKAITPHGTGTYLIRISAYSVNDASLVAEFKVSCGLLGPFDATSPTIAHL